jgi:hypothetical protein
MDEHYHGCPFRPPRPIEATPSASTATFSQDEAVGLPASGIVADDLTASIDPPRSRQGCTGDIDGAEDLHHLLYPGL